MNQVFRFYDLYLFFHIHFNTSLIKTMLKKTIFMVCLIFLASGKPKLTLGAGGFGFGCGSNSPAAQVPYSYVRLGPDTAPLLKK